MDMIESVIITVSKPGEAMERALVAFGGEPQGARIGFTSAHDLLSVLTPSRWDMVLAMVGQGPMSIRHLGRLVERDHRRVHADARLLVESGIIDETEDGRIVFPFASVRLELSSDDVPRPIVEPRKMGRPRTRTPKRPEAKLTGTG